MTHKKVKRKADSRRQWSGLPLLLLAAALVVAVAAIALVALNARGGESVVSGGGGPQLTVNQERIDFGKVPFDKSVRAEFKLTNSGAGTLTLDTTTPIRVLEGC